LRSTAMRSEAIATICNVKVEQAVADPAEGVTSSDRGAA
jgi:hypothetical protein